MSPAAAASVIGFLTSLSLIVAIGAQNAFVLRQGLRREHVRPVVLVCALADAALIVVGVAGLGALVTAHPVSLEITRYAGGAFLLGYAGLAAGRALRPRTLAASAYEPASLRAVLLTCLALTFLNPHVYLDTVVLLGSLANQYGGGRWYFAAGAAAGSFVWFSVLGYGAGRLSRWFARPGSWRVLDAAIAAIMLTLAVSLLIPTRP